MRYNTNDSLNIIKNLNEAEEREIPWEQKKVVYEQKRDELINSIDLQPLYDKIKEVSGVNTQFKHEVKDGREGKYIEITSDDILDSCGVFSKVLKYCRLETFNTELPIKDKDDLDKCYAYFWGTIHLDYEHTGGGHNGMELLRFDYNYNNDGKWQFKSVNEGLIC